MKKLMFAATAALCAAVGYSEGITSANVVGYMDKAADNASGYTWMVNTFEKIDGTTVKLSDFTIKENLAPTAAKLYLMSKTGATAVDSTSGKEQVFVYLNPTKAGTKAIPGWYYDGTQSKDMQGPGSAGWASDIAVPYGQGFGLYRGTSVATLVFSGGVAASDTEIPASNASGYTWMGNVMPVNMTLADLSIKENLAPTAAKLYFMSKTGATAVDTTTGKEQVFVYLNPTKAGTKAVPGWYYDGTQSKDMQGPGSAGWASDIAIPAGQAFGLYRGTTAATLIVPSPLAD